MDGQQQQQNGVLGEILRASNRAAAEAAKACAKAEECSSGIDRLRRQHRVMDGRLRGVEVGLANLQGHRAAAEDAGKNAGKKAGRAHGAGWAAAIVALAGLAQQVWPYVASALGFK